jgi:ADP-ribosylglycohydrolase
MLVEIAVADAYGIGFEFSDPTEGRPNDASAYVPNPRYPNHVAGTYTDDGQMSLAVAECLLDGGRTKRDFATWFVRAFQRDPRDEYSRGYQAFIESVTDVDDFLARIDPSSDRNGAAMRATPIGLLADISEVLDVAAVQASVTHDTPMGIASAQGSALMAHHQAHRIGPLSELTDFLIHHVPAIDWATPNTARVKVKGEQTVRAALAVLLASTTKRDVLVETVRIGGDTDTVAAVAMGVASVSSEIAGELPAELLASLEGGPFGSEWLGKTDGRLLANFGH